MVSLIREIEDIVKGIIRERRETECENTETNHERLLTLGNKALRKERWVGVWGNWVMGTEEGT